MNDYKKDPAQKTIASFSTLTQQISTFARNFATLNENLIIFMEMQRKRWRIQFISDIIIVFLLFAIVIDMMGYELFHVEIMTRIIRAFHALMQP